MIFLTFDEMECVRYVMIKIHAKFMWLGQPSKITTDVIKAVTYLNQTCEKLGFQKVTKPTIRKLTNAKFDGQ